VSEPEVLEIYKHVHGPEYDYEYDIKEDVFKVADYLKFREEPEVQAGAKAFKESQAIGVKSAPAL
jgi:hypothetical protein